jgi:hypothetical protein
MRDENLKSTERIGSSRGRITWKFVSKTEVTLRNKEEKEQIYSRNSKRKIQKECYRIFKEGKMVTAIVYNVVFLCCSVLSFELDAVAQ